jgi:hypothetical protein
MTVTTMKRIHVDFNTLNCEPVDLVKVAAPGTPQEQALPPLTPGERVVLYDEDGLEVEGLMLRDDAGWWLAEPDSATWRDAPAPTEARLEQA